MCNVRMYLVLCVFLHFFVIPAQGALVPKNSAKLADAFNPHAHASDVLLPMPCKLSMAFKVVGVPAEGFLWDMSTRFGYDNPGNAQRLFYDSRHTTTLAAPFSAKDLPLNWVKEAPKGKFSYYLIGKYEVTALQYEAIMTGQCPTPNNKNVRPKTDITWYDAVAFSQKYTEWLLKNAPKSLPRFNGDSRNVGFLRLPTEVEWEYAARGGHKSTSQELLESNFFPMKKGDNYEDYAVFRPENVSRIAEHPARIGSRKANALGIYDSAGNAAEMVLDIFRFSLGGRLHGSAGGFVRKGGSYLSGLEEIYPGRREEVAFFQQQGAVSMRDLGFRLVLSGINTPGGDRQDVLQKEWAKVGNSSVFALNKNSDPLKEIDRLIATTASDVEKKNYQHIHTLLKENYISFERQQTLIATSEVRSMAFIIESIKSINSRINIIQATLPKVIRMRNEDKAEGKEIAHYTKTIEKGYDGIKNFKNAIEQSVLFYKTKMEDIRYMNPRIVSASLEQVKKELEKTADANVFNKKLLENIHLFQKHLQAFYANNFDAVSAAQLQKDILQ